MSRAKGPEREQQNLKLTPETRDDLETLATRRGLTKGQVVEQLVREEMKREKRRSPDE